MNFSRLDEKNLELACRILSEKDADLARVFQRYKTPPLWKREENFATLVHIILEQQVSLASALGAFNKLKEKLGAITPEKILSLTDAEMRQAYLSRQKTAYVRNLAQAVFTKNLNLKKLRNLSDEEARAQLKRIKGIGDWTADIYLLMAMQRADVMPKGDLALPVAWQKLKNLPEKPSAAQFASISEKWKPLRSAAARLLWHFYLSERQTNL